MRNLKLCESLLVDFAASFGAVRRIAIDYDTKVVYLASATHVAAFDPASQQVKCVLDLVAEGYASDDGFSLLDVEPLPEARAVCVATTGGDVLLWKADDLIQLECVGSVDSGLCAMAWSPDQEIVVFATGQDTLILMTQEFEPITEVAMHPAGFGEAEAVSVGWGKKETQFRGSEGKHISSCVDQSTPSLVDGDDRLTRIRWRGDGQFFCVSSLTPDSGARCLRIWSRDGTLHSTSEPVDRLEHALAWKPSGRLIASSQYKHQKHEIIFFEKNGLRHGEFTLPICANRVKVKELMWNIDSTILAVWCERQPADGSSVCESYIDLWTMGNYHWYLKQRLPARRGSTILAVQWDAEQASYLHVVCSDSSYLRASWSSATDVACDSETVAVIDGNRLLVTPFNKICVPPPMCALEVGMPCPVVSVAFATEDDSMAVLLVDSTIAIFSYGEEHKDVNRSDVKIAYTGGTPDTCQLPHIVGLFRTQQSQAHLLRMAFQSRHLGYVFSTGALFSLQFDLEKQTVSETRCCSLPAQIFGTPFLLDANSIVIQSQDGAVHIKTADCHSFTPWRIHGEQALQFPRPCSYVVATEMAGQKVLLGLTDRYRLYANDTEVANNCTSMAVHSDFVVLTTHSPHACRFIRRSDPLKAMLSSSSSTNDVELSRRLERGGRIVCVAHHDTQLVLQMPRGNLETVHPRPFVLRALQRHIDSFRFAEAYQLMRMHRVDLNLLHDHDPEAFLGRLDAFVSQIDNVTYLNQFLTDLRCEDVTQTLYSSSYSEKKAKADGPEADNERTKVDVICDSLRQTFLSIDPERYLLCIVTSHVKKSSPDTEAALAMIKELQSKPDGGQTAERVLSHLLFLVKVDDLYKVALGTYDLQLALLVAEKSQKDPKEYLSFLNDLHRLPADYQRYTIDKHLKRYAKALIHIRKCEDRFSECLNFVIEHQLYSQAMRLFVSKTDQFKAVAKAYGDYLSDCRLAEEAGYAYSRAGEGRLAMEAFSRGLCWRQALCAADRAAMDRTEVTALARTLADRLKEDKRHCEAACLLEQYVQDVEEAIVTLIDGCQWDESMRLMHKHNRLDFIETNLKPSLQTTCSVQREFLTNSGALFVRHRDRLAIVRCQKEKEMLGMLEEGYAADGVGDATDLFSDTSSVSKDSFASVGKSSTTSSTASGRSSKSRRKTERKKWSLKEGGVHEENALVDALSKIVKQVETAKADIAALLRAMIAFDFDAEIEELQTTFEQMISLVTKSLPQIWPSCQSNTNTQMNVPNLGPATTVNAITQAVRMGQSLGAASQLDPSLQMAPPMNTSFKWKLDISSH